MTALYSCAAWLWARGLGGCGAVPRHQTHPTSGGGVWRPTPRARGARRVCERVPASDAVDHCRKFSFSVHCTLAERPTGGACLRLMGRTAVLSCHFHCSLSRPSRRARSPHARAAGGGPVGAGTPGVRATRCCCEMLPCIHAAIAVAAVPAAAAGGCLQLRRAIAFPLPRHARPLVPVAGRRHWWARGPPQVGTQQRIWPTSARPGWA